MAETLAWKPTRDEIRGILTELAPVFDECVRRSRRLLDAAAGPQPQLAAVARA